MEEKIWERQPSESAPAYEAFKVFLAMPSRRLIEVAGQLKKSPQLISRWCNEHAWRRRSLAFDRSVLEESRLELSRQVGEQLKQQWNDAVALQAAAMEALRSKDLSKASFKSLVEIFNSAVAVQNRLVETLELDKLPDKDVRIEIVPARRTEPKAQI